MSRVRRRHGFTLIEVLIALAIVATTLGGVLAIVRGAIDNQEYLERRLFATWVADNVFNAYRLEPARFDERNREGQEVVLGRRLDWSLEVERLERPEADEDAPPALPRERVTVVVGDSAAAAAAPLASLTRVLAASAGAP